MQTEDATPVYQFSVLAAFYCADCTYSCPHADLYSMPLSLILPWLISGHKLQCLLGPVKFRELSALNGGWRILLGTMQIKSAQVLPDMEGSSPYCKSVGPLWPPDFPEKPEISIFIRKFSGRTGQRKLAVPWTSACCLKVAASTLVPASHLPKAAIIIGAVV